MAPKREGLSNAEAKEKSRDALIKAGTRLFVRDKKHSPFARLKVDDVCREAGYTNGAFYGHWNKLEDYHEDLGRWLLGGSPDSMYDKDFRTLTKELAGFLELGAAEGILGLAARDLQLLLKNPYWEADAAVSSTWGRTRLRKEAVEGYRHTDEQTAELYGALLARLGREPRPPLTIRDLGVLLQSLIEGVGLRAKIEGVPPHAESEPDTSLYSVGVASFLAVLTRPIGDGDDVPAELNQLLQQAPQAS